MIITFINLKPNIKSNHPRHILPPLDIGYCASLLEKRGNKVNLIDLRVKDYSINEIIHYTKEKKTDLMIIKPMIHTVEFTLRLAKKVKNKVKKIILIGHFSSLYYRSFISEYSGVDLVILNEPELTLLEFVENYKRDKNTNKIRGIAYYNNKIVKTKPRDLIKDLDSLPFPKHELFVNKGYTFYYPVNIKKKINVGYILSSRGCPHNCVFCSSVERDSYGKDYRIRSPKNIADEMELLENYGVNVIYFIDDTFTESSSHVSGVCDEMIKRKIDIKWVAQSRIDTLNRELLVKMKKAGCSTLCLGIESGSDRILQILNKDVTVNQIKKVCKMIKQNGVWILADYIINNPTERKKEMQDTLNLAKQLLPEMINVSYFTMYNPQQFGNVDENLSRFSITSNFTDLNDKELTQFQKHFYQKYYLNPKFLIQFIYKQGIFAVLNWRQFIFDTLKYLLKDAP